MGTTPTMGIPFPESTDPVANGAQNMEDLATTVDNKTGLIFVKSQPFAAANSLVVTNAFSSAFDAYRIVLSGYSNPAASDIGITLQLNNATGSTYAYWLNYWQYGAAQGQASATNNTTWICGWSNQNGGNLVMDIVNPNRASYTTFTSANTTQNYYMIQGGTEKSNSQHTGFTLSCSVAFAAAGAVRVYGYHL